MKAISISLKEAVTDNSLLKIGEGALSVKKRGNGSGYSAIAVNASSGNVQVRLANKNGFISDIAGASEGATSKQLKSGNNIFYITLWGDDSLIFTSTSNILSLGTTTAELCTPNNNSSPVINDNVFSLSDFPNITYVNYNSPYISGYISDLKYLSALDTIYLNNSTIGGDIKGLATSGIKVLGALNSQIEGKLSDLPSGISSISLGNTGITGSLYDLRNKASLTSISLGGTAIEGNINDLPPTVQTIYLAEIYSGITYTGGQANKFPTLNSVNIGQCALSTAQLDNLLISLSTSNWVGGKSIVLKGVRSAVSDGAITTLASKGVSVTINQY